MHLLGAGYHYCTFPIIICCLLSFHTVSMYISFLFEMPRMLLHFCCMTGSSLMKPTREIIFCKCILLVLQRYRTPHLYRPAYLNWLCEQLGIHYCAGFLVFKEATAVKVCRKRKNRTSKAHTCADETPNIYPTNVCPGGVTSYG